MMTQTLEKRRFFDQLEQFEKAGRNSPFQSLRQSARARLRELDFPTPRTEDWRFTNVASLLKMPFELPPETRIAATKLPILPARDTYRLVFVNGAFAPGLTSAKAPDGISVGNLGGIDTNEAGRLREAVGTTDYKSQVFTALNTAFLRDGAYLVVPDGTICESPIEIVYLSVPASQPIMTHPRTVVTLGRGSRVTIVERYVASGEAEKPGVYFTNTVTEIAVAEGAQVDHYKLQDESRQAYHIGNTQVHQAQNSRFTTHYLSLGGSLVRNEVRVRFDGEGAEATVNGLYLGSGRQHIDNFTVIDHAQPRCASHELYKGILSDEAHGVFNGKIFVRPDAQKTDAKQTNKVLLLSENATINTKPQLEIFADDVKCTHGATVGQLDAESLFYLRTRGIGLQEARALLTYAFANDIIGRIKLDELRDWLEQKVRQPEDRGEA